MGKSKRREYTLEFKSQSVDLANRIGLYRAAEQLGVHVTNIRRWKEDNKLSSSKSNQSKVSYEEENKQLRKENEELKKVNFILKKAAAFFSQDHLK